MVANRGRYRMVSYAKRDTKLWQKTELPAREGGLHRLVRDHIGENALISFFFRPGIIFLFQTERSYGRA